MGKKADTPQDAVAAAMRAARQKPTTRGPAAKALLWVYENLISWMLPKRKTLVRATLFGLLGTLPFMLLVAALIPKIVLPLIVGVIGALYLLGAGDEFAKQLRWMKRMSSNGPIFWGLERLRKLSIRVARATYGDKMDVLPLAPSALGTSSRGATRAVIKWIPDPSSQFSVETYEVEMRIAAQAEGSELAEWLKLCDEPLAKPELALTPLTADISYEVRVRAVNSKGPSEWRELTFTTKQAPSKSADGEKAGGSGPGYTWQQSLRDDNLYVVVGPLPAGTRAKQLEVAVMPTHISVKMSGAPAELLAGDFFGTVGTDDVEWELRDMPEAKGPRELHMTLTKTGKTAGSTGALWTQLLKAGPEVDMSGVKRVEKSIDEMMAELQKSTGVHPMDGMDHAKNVRERAMGKGQIPQM